MIRNKGEQLDRILAAMSIDLSLNHIKKLAEKKLSDI